MPSRKSNNGEQSRVDVGGELLCRRRRFGLRQLPDRFDLRMSQREMTPHGGDDSHREQRHGPKPAQQDRRRTFRRKGSLRLDASDLGQCADAPRRFRNQDCRQVVVLQVHDCGNLGDGDRRSAVVVCRTIRFPLVVLQTRMKGSAPFVLIAGAPQDISRRLQAVFDPQRAPCGSLNHQTQHEGGEPKGPTDRFSHSNVSQPLRR